MGNAVPGLGFLHGVDEATFGCCIHSKQEKPKGNNGTAVMETTFSTIVYLAS